MKEKEVKMLTVLVDGKRVTNVTPGQVETMRVQGARVVVLPDRQA